MELPKNIKTMLEIANKLANDFVFVRVDLYNLDGKIYFGEMTFNSAAGYDVPYPGEYDLELGKLMKIDLSKHNVCFYTDDYMDEEESVFTYTPIPPECIKKINIKYDDLN